MNMVVCGVGNEMRQDDGIGIWVVNHLKKMGLNSNIRFINCYNFPEDYVDEIKDYGTELVFVIDGADFGGDIGEVRELSPDEIDNFTISTHTLPLSIFAFLLREEGIKVIFMGIQVLKTGIGKGFSKPLREKIPSIISQIKERIEKEMQKGG